MKTRKDAERVIELSDQREQLQKLAAGIRIADTIAVCDPQQQSKGYRSVGEPTSLFNVTHLADELRDLVKRETDQQIAAIDQELVGLGVVPDEFDAAAPAEPEGTAQERTTKGDSQARASQIAGMSNKKRLDPFADAYANLQKKR